MVWIGGQKLSHIFRYIIKRSLQTLVVLFCVVLVSFFLIRIAGGNPARMVLPESATEEAVAAMEIKLGLDKPLPVQFLMYVSDLLHGDLGTSSHYSMPVLELVTGRLPNTLLLAFSSVLVGCMLCIPLGIIAGSNKGSIIDFITMFFALLGQSMATVWLAVLLIFVFSVELGWLPAIGTGSVKNMILPVLTLAYPMAAETTRMGRSGMIDALGEDYITATYAKGIKPFVVNWKYAFKNAVCPVITLIGIKLGTYLGGTIVVESIFSWPGIGQLLVTAIGQRDYALVQSLLLVNAAMFAIVNLIVDIINSFVDPRISL